MTTIGTAVLQIIPSLKGVSDAIEKQIDGKVVEVKVAPKVDKAAATKAGKEAGETIAKETKAAVSKGEIGKAVTDDIKTSVKKASVGKEVSKALTDDVKKSSPGKEIGKVIVEGLADGVKQGLPSGSGGLGDRLIKSVADDAKAAAKNSKIGSSLGTVLTEGLIDGIKDAFSDSGPGKAITAGLNDLSGNVKTALKPIIDVASSATLGIQGLQTAIDAAKNHDLQGTVSAIVTPLKELEKIGLPEGFTKTLQDAAANSKTVGDNVRGVTDPIREAGKGTKVEKWTDRAGVIGDLVQSLVFLKDAFGSFGTWLNSQNWSRYIDPGVWGDNAREAIARNNANAPRGRIVDPASGLPAVQANEPANSRDSGGVPAPRNSTGLPAAQANAPASTRDSGGVPVFIDPKLLQHRAVGGQISGPGTGISDSILLRASDGEFIVNADATRKNLPLLEIINSGKLPGFAGGGLVAGDQQLRQIIMDRFGISDIGGYRPADKYGEHSTGRALDVMVGNNKSKGDAVKDFALQNASAIDLKWAIWRQHLYYPGGGGYDMPDRGSPTQNHMDHVHIFSGTGITNGLRGALAGGPGVGIAAGVGVHGASGPGAEDTSSSDQAAAGSSAGGGGFGSLPGSLSGLSSFGLNGLGSGVGTTGSGSDLSLFGNAAGSAVSGQVSSALGVLGVGDSPGWLKAASQLVGGIKVSDKSTGKSLFDGANPLGSLFGQGSGSSAAPISASSTGMGTPPPDTAHGGRAGQAPGPQTVVNYSIRTATVEDAFLAAQRKQNERNAAKISVF
jgi:hypothetical protein